MQLPDREKARVPKGKITEYLLVPEHPDAEGKAPFFLACGFRADHWEAFAGALRRHAAAHPVRYTKEIPFGTLYTVEGLLETPPEAAPTSRPVRSVWIVEREGDAPRLVSAYPIDF